MEIRVTSLQQIMKRKIPASIDPNLDQYIQEQVRQEVARLMSPVLELAGLKVVDPSQQSVEFVFNPEAREILEMNHDTLLLKIKAGELIEGIHFQGKGKRRVWRRDRLTRYLATEGNELQRVKDITQWQREGFAAHSNQSA